MLRIAALFMLVGVAPALAQNTVALTPYFPATEGASWTYRLADRQVTVKVAKHEKQGDVMTARMETLDKGEVVAVQHVLVTDKQVARLAHNGEKVGPPLTVLQLPPAKGQSWEVDSKTTSQTSTDQIKGKFTTAEEDVKVPAGEYKKTLRVTADLSINGKKATVTSWYAERVGLVKQVIGIDGRDIELVLEKVESPK